LQLDDHLKNLLRELGHAINDTVSESDRITGAIAGVRAHGYDIVLKLDATIGLAKRDAAAAADAPSKLTTQDKRFLESLRIQVDQESFEQDQAQQRRYQHHAQCGKLYILSVLPIFPDHDRQYFRSWAV